MSHTPEFSLWRLQKAMHARDPVEIETYLDINGILDIAMDESGATRVLLDRGGLGIYLRQRVKDRIRHDVLLGAYESGWENAKIVTVVRRGHAADATVQRSDGLAYRVVLQQLPSGRWRVVASPTLVEECKGYVKEIIIDQR